MEIGSIQQVDIDAQMRSAYLDYAMSVIVSRALPDSRDGLKPVHRRILYAMHDMGIRSNTPYRKSARIVGEVLGKYHPTGMPRCTKPWPALRKISPCATGWSMGRAILAGSMAMLPQRCATPRHAWLLWQRSCWQISIKIRSIRPQIRQLTSGTCMLPARMPNLLLNGSSGIAVGMATNIPPHNLRELSAAVVYLIDNYDHVDDIPVEDLMKHLPGPDFPTGGVIVGSEGIRQAYSTGRGRIVLRGLAHIEEMSGNRHRIVITEIPYQLNKTSLIERIAELAREGKLDDITDLRDESDRRGMSIIIELKRGAQPKKVQNQLYKYTPLQSTFGVQMLALVEGEPRLLSLRRSLQIFIDHRREVLTRRSKFELEKASAHGHILEGLLIALANLDAVIQTIRQSPDAEAAKERLMFRFLLSERQAQAILDMQLRRLAALERQKIEDEQKEILRASHIWKTCWPILTKSWG